LIAESERIQYTDITLTICSRFKEIFDRVAAEKKYTFDEMCYSVAMRIRELGGNRSSDCKASTVNEIGRCMG